MFLDDDNIPVLPEWEEQIQQLEQMQAEDAQGAVAPAAEQ